MKQHRHGMVVFRNWTQDRELELAMKTIDDIQFGQYPFPLERILPGLFKFGHDGLYVEWTHPPDSPAWGMYWHNGTITLIQGWPEAAAAALAHEVAHAVDFLSLNDDQRRRLHAVLHERPGNHFRGAEKSLSEHIAAEKWWGYENPPGGGDAEYWHRPLEGYGQGFLESFVPQYDNSQYTHGVESEAAKAQIRAISMEGYIQVFTDVPSTHPHAAAINEMAGLGIAAGRDNGDGTRRFDPDKPVTRGEVMAFLSRSMKVKSGN